METISSRSFVSDLSCHLENSEMSFNNNNIYLFSVRKLTDNEQI